MKGLFRRNLLPIRANVDCDDEERREKGAGQLLSESSSSIHCKPEAKVVNFR